MAPEFSVEQFEKSRRENGIAFWYAHEFMDALGYETWASFQGVINKAIASCAKLNIDATENFQSDTYLDPEGRPCKTFRLTRFACLLIAVNADSKKPQVAKAKTVLAALLEKLIQHHIAEHEFGRIETREDLKTAEQVMGAVAQQHGLESPQFGLFKDSGFRGMYNMGLRDLVKHKGLPAGETLYDFMGLEELAGNLFRVTQTAARIKNKGVKGVVHLSQTAREVGHEVRTIMVGNSGVAPEALPISEDITSVKKRIRSAHRKLKKLDTPKKRKALPPPGDA